MHSGFQNALRLSEVQINLSDVQQSKQDLELETNGFQIYAIAPVQDIPTTVEAPITIFRVAGFARFNFGRQYDLPNFPNSMI